MSPNNITLVFSAAALFFGCEMGPAESVYHPGNEAYPGKDWSRDWNGSGVADSVEKYAPGCTDNPAECLRQALIAASLTVIPPQPRPIPQIPVTPPPSETLSVIEKPKEKVEETVKPKKKKPKSKPKRKSEKKKK